MRRVRRGGLALVAAVLTAAVSPSVGVAQEAEHVLGSAAPGWWLVAVPLVLLPSALGPEVAFEPEGGRDPRFLLAWPFQAPVPFSKGRLASHRVVAALELALGTGNGARWRGRAGYRHAGDVVIVGAGTGVDRAAWFLSPEIGVRLPRPNRAPGLHAYATLLVRGDVPYASPEQVRVSLMVGWVIF